MDLNQLLLCIAEELLESIPDNSIDLILTDPDHGRGKIKSTFAGVPTAFIISHFNRILKDTGNIVMFGTGMFTADMMILNRDRHKYNIIWEKDRTTDPLNANRKPLPCHEDIMIFNKSLATATYNPQKVKGKPAKSIGKVAGGDSKTSLYGGYKRQNTVSDMKFPRTVLKFPAISGSKKRYPTEKPLSLAEWLVKTYSNPGDIVFDCYFGSGVFLEAAKILERHYIGCDKSETAYAEAKRRGL